MVGSVSSAEGVCVNVLTYIHVSLAYTGKLCHRGKCHSGNCHSGERWMSRPFVHSGNLNFKHTLTNDLVFHNA